MSEGDYRAKTIMVTGGAGFIGSAVIRRLMEVTDATVVNIDKLTYAGNPDSLISVEHDPRYHFERVDICDASEIGRLFKEYSPDAVMHLAAETHVDRSIDGPETFVETNVVGTLNLLEASRLHLMTRSRAAHSPFRFLHVSTDEVFGSLFATGQFTERSPYLPSSPYSASKASSDHLVRAWHRTYGLPTVITNSSNNYGPWQYPEKLIPVLIGNALAGRALPIYGAGDNVRDWLYVDDHADVLVRLLTGGMDGETYCIGGGEERTNLEMAEAICALLDELAPNSLGAPYSSQIDFVADRPGHDFRYSTDTSKVRKILDWQPRETLESGLRRTVQWYLDRARWVENSVHPRRRAAG